MKFENAFRAVMVWSTNTTPPFMCVVVMVKIYLVKIYLVKIYLLGC